MNEPSPTRTPEAEEPGSPPQPPPRPGFGFLVGGTTLGIFFGCVLLCAGTSPPHVIIIVLSICGAITGGLLESLWPKSYRIQQPPPRKKPPRTTPDEHECLRCGEMFEPSPVICPMCGHHGKSRRIR